MSRTKNGSVETRMGPMLLDGVPQEILARFADSAAEGEEVSVDATADVSPDGRFGHRYLLASNKRLWIVTPSDNGEQSEREWSMDKLSKAKVETEVGASILKAEIDGDNVELLRFSNTLQRTFHHVAKHLNSLAEDGKPAHITDDSGSRYCDKCGRLVNRRRGGICSACLDKRKVLMRLTSYLRPHVGTALVMVGFMAAVAVLEMVPAYLTSKLLIDDLLMRGEVSSLTLIPTLWTVDVSAWGYDKVLWLGILVMSIVVTRIALVALRTGQGRVTAALGLKITRDLRATVYHHIQRLSLSYHDKVRVGSLMSRVLTDVSQVNGFLVSGVPQVGVMVLKLLSIGGLLTLMNPTLTAWVLLPIPLVIVASKIFFSRVRGLFHRQSQRYSLMSAALNDSLNGVRVVRAFGQEEQEIGKFASRVGDWFTAGLKAEKAWFTFYPFIGFISTSGAFIVYYVGGWDVLDGNMSLGTLLAFMVYLMMFYEPISWLANINRWVTRDLTAAERIFEVLDTTPDLVERPDAIRLKRPEGEVRLENVHFGYDPLDPVLKGVDLTVKPGEMIGLVGRSGAGKSTLINLVCRFYDPQEGRILIDGKDLTEISLSDWNANLGIVPQESFLFYGTVAANISYANPDATMEDIIRAARAANAHNFISRLPDGYDSMVGQRGMSLSGGERQRISIARAILHDPKILILDEATSSLDTETEQQIQEAFAALVKGRTVFAIAHRLSTLKHANRLVVIDDGKVAEQGTHDELLEQEGIYFGLVQAQLEMSALQGVGG